MITFKGVTATSLNAIVNVLPLQRLPKRRSFITELENVDGATIDDLGASGIVIPVKITVKSLTDLDSVLAWLTGSGVLIRNDVATKYWNAYIIDGIDFVQNKSTWEGSVDFFIPDPYRYVVSEGNTTIIASPGAVTNQGNASALPLIKVTGSGTVVLTVNGSALTYVFGAESAIYIDCKSKDCYTDPNNINTTLKNLSLSGTFPTLSAGSNVVSWTGTITQVLITPRSRWY